MFKGKRTAIGGTLVVALFLSLLTLLTPGKALAAYDCFLMIDGITGESIEAKHRNFIEITSWNFSETQTGTMHVGGGGGAGKVNMKDFKFTMRMSKASPKLFLACASGQHFKEAILEVCRAGGKDSSAFLRIKLSEVMVSSFLILGNSKSAEAYPIEEVSLNFAKMEIEYKPMNPDGTFGAPVRAGFDLKQNKQY